jgi:hypothetical protein
MSKNIYQSRHRFFCLCYLSLTKLILILHGTVLRTMNIKRYFYLDWLIVYCCTYRSRIVHLHVETSPLPVKGCKFSGYARRSEPLSREGALLCHTCCDMGPRFFRSHSIDGPSQSPLTTNKGMWRIYSNSDSHSVAFYDKGDAMDLFVCGSSWASIWKCKYICFLFLRFPMILSIQIAKYPRFAIYFILTICVDLKFVVVFYIF